MPMQDTLTQRSSTLPLISLDNIKTGLLLYFNFYLSLVISLLYYIYIFISTDSTVTIDLHTNWMEGNEGRHLVGITGVTTSIQPLKCRCRTISHSDAQLTLLTVTQAHTLV